MLVLKQNQDIVTKVGVIDVRWPTCSQSPPHSVSVRNHPNSAAYVSNDLLVLMIPGWLGSAGRLFWARLGSPMKLRASGYSARPGGCRRSQSRVWGLGAACVWASGHGGSRVTHGWDRSSGFLMHLWETSKEVQVETARSQRPGLWNFHSITSVPFHWPIEVTRPTQIQWAGRYCPVIGGWSLQNIGGSALPTTCHLPCGDDAP